MNLENLEWILILLIIPTAFLAIVVCVIVLLCKNICKFWRRMRRRRRNDDNNHEEESIHNGGDEVGVDNISDERVNPDNIELFLRLRNINGLNRINMQQPQTLLHQTEEALKNLPPPEDYESYKETMSSSTECAICLDEFQSGELCRLLPLCNHLYHFRCINRWLADYPTCPICRTSLLSNKSWTTLFEFFTYTKLLFTFSISL